MKCLRPQDSFARILSILPRSELYGTGVEAIRTPTHSLTPRSNTNRGRERITQIKGGQPRGLPLHRPRLSRDLRACSQPFSLHLRAAFARRQLWWRERNSRRWRMLQKDTYTGRGTLGEVEAFRSYAPTSLCVVISTHLPPMLNSQAERDSAYRSRPSQTSLLRLETSARRC
jgi:hypothetical protein